MRILGIEFGAWSLKAVEMESRFRKVEILDLHEVRMPIQNADPTNAYQQGIGQLMARLPSHPEKIVASIPAAQTALRFLSMPIKQRKKVEHSFRFEIEDSIPFKLNDSIIEHHVNKTRDGSLVFAAIAPKKHVQGHIDWLKALGLDPDWLTFEGMGIINLFLAAREKKDAEPLLEPVLLLDIGHLKTNLAVFNQGRLEMFRTVSWGGFSITQSIAMGLTISLEDAEQRKIRSLRLDEEAQVKDTETEDLIISATQAFSSFVTDVSHSAVTYRSQYKQEIAQILLTGGTAKVTGIEDFLGKSLQLPVGFFRPFQEMKLSKDIDVSQEMRFGEPLGRAFVFARNSPLLFNFRKQELAKGTSLTEVSNVLQNPTILRLLAYSGVLILILAFHVILATQFSKNDADKASVELRKVFQDTFQTVPPKLVASLTKDPDELKNFITKKNNELDQKIKMISKRRTPMLSYVSSISQAFPDDVRVDINALYLDDKSLKLEGVLYEGGIENTLEALKKNAQLANVTMEKNGQRFTLKAEVVGR